jgi:hypothetical protein
METTKLFFLVSFLFFILSFSQHQNEPKNSDTTQRTRALSEQRTIQKNGRERKYHHQNETKNWSETRSRYRWRWICRVALVRCLGRGACFYSLSSRRHHT